MGLGEAEDADTGAEALSPMGFGAQVRSGSLKYGARLARPGFG